MPINYKYSKEKNIIWGTFEGHVTIKEIKSKIESIVTSPEHKPEVKALWDLRKMDFGTVTTIHIQHLISLQRLYPERGMTKIALVADEALNYGMARMYEMLSFGAILPDIMTFRTCAEAEDWLLTD